MKILELIAILGWMIFGWIDMYRRHGVKKTMLLFGVVMVLAFIASRFLR